MTASFILVFVLGFKVAKHFADVLGSLPVSYVASKICKFNYKLIFHIVTSVVLMCRCTSVLVWYSGVDVRTKLSILNLVRSVCYHLLGRSCSGMPHKLQVLTVMSELE